MPKQHHPVVPAVVSTLQRPWVSCYAVWGTAGDSNTAGIEDAGGRLCSGLAATYLEVCTDEQLVLDDAMADRACAAAALRSVLAFSPGAKVIYPHSSIYLSSLQRVAYLVSVCLSVFM